MKGKSKSKTVPITGKVRTRLSLKDKRRIIAWRTEGKTREDVQKLLGNSGTEIQINICMWRKIWRERESIKSAVCPLKDFNLRHKVTDNPVRKQFEEKVKNTINEKAKTMQIDYKAVRSIMEDVQKEEDFFKISLMLSKKRFLC